MWYPTLSISRNNILRWICKMGFLHHAQVGKICNPLQLCAMLVNCVGAILKLFLDFIFKTDLTSRRSLVPKFDPTTKIVHQIRNFRTYRPTGWLVSTPPLVLGSRREANRTIIWIPLSLWVLWKINRCYCTIPTAKNLI